MVADGHMKGKALLPRLHLDKQDISILNIVLNEYVNARKLLAEELAEDAESEDGDGSDLDEEDEGSDEEDFDEDEEDEEEDDDDEDDDSEYDYDYDDFVDDDEDLDYETRRLIRELEDVPNSQDTFTDELSSVEGDPFIDEDDVPDALTVSMSNVSLAQTSGVSPKDLIWLEGIGFPPLLALDALKETKGKSRIDSLVKLYSRVDPAFSKNPNPLVTFGSTDEDMMKIRFEEKMVLSSMFPEGFEEVNSLMWRIVVDTTVPDEFLPNGPGNSLNFVKPKVCQYFLSGKCKRGNRCNNLHEQPGTSPSMASVRPPNPKDKLLSYALEIHFPEGNKYPFERPIVIFRDVTDRLPARLCLFLSLGLFQVSLGWVGEPMVFSLYSWLQGDEARSILLSPPSSFVRLSEDSVPESLPKPVSKPIRGATIQTRDSPPRKSGPVPGYDDLWKGVGVAIILKQDQPTGITVEGFVDEVLTSGDHPRGVKVRLKDGRVGRVQFLTGKTQVPQKTPPKSSKPTLTDKVRAELAAASSPSKSSKPQSSFISSMDTASSLRNKLPTDVTPLPALPPVQDIVESENLQKISQKLHDASKKQQESEAFKSMQAQREKLPAFAMKKTIVDAINKNRIIVISGETGCGKSTQVPQFVLDDAIARGKGASCKILVTQPRRISAIGLCERVASERAEKAGNTVGYQIRLENKISDATRITFCTTGILLRRLEDGADSTATTVKGDGIEDVSHVIVDEVHERSLDSDFLLMVLRDLLITRHDLRIVMMSATLNAELFASYFGGAQILHIPGRTFPVRALFLEDALAKVNYKVEGADYTRKFSGKGKSKVDMKGKNILPLERPSLERAFNPDVPDEELDARDLMKRYPRVGENGAKTLMQMDLDKIHYPLIELLVIWMIEQMMYLKGESSSRTTAGFHERGRGSRGGLRGSRGGRGRGSFPSSSSNQQQNHFAGSGIEFEQENRCILIFLPGFAEIVTLHEGLLQNPRIRSATGNGQYCLALHSTLSSEEQMRVFNRPPKGTVKIVIATNVAETSITIDDVTFVIDSGRMKETRFEPTKGMASLEECWVSRANALQRRGRAGRVQEGTCVHLFTSFKFQNEFLEQQLPEILRVPLEQICLRIKILPFLKGSISNILCKMIEPPTPDSIRAAIGTLRVLQVVMSLEDVTKNPKALSKEENLTALGFHLGRLPVDVRIGKLILLGSIFRCLDPILTIASAMSIKSPFVAPFDKRDLADAKKMEFATSLSDHLTVLTAYNQWQAERRNGFPNERRFLFDNFLSGKTLNMIASVKRQLVELLSDINFVKDSLRSRDIELRGGRQSDGVAEAIGETQAAPDLELIKALLVSALYPNSNN
ncbi:ATPdependent RNA helicase [Phlyctochytrium planicorne]|nr:ATPdependent RNA helicase [Phlyctochytrium planicorne]